MKKILFLILIAFLNCSKTEMTLDEKQKAKNIFNANCMTCHGEKGYGDGPSASAFNPPPRNFHLPTEKWVNGKTLEGITKTLVYGIQPNMWAYHGSKDEIDLLAKYVLFLGNSNDN